MKSTPTNAYVYPGVVDRSLPKSPVWSYAPVRAGNKTKGAPHRVAHTTISPLSRLVLSDVQKENTLGLNIRAAPRNRRPRVRRYTPATSRWTLLRHSPKNRGILGSKAKHLIEAVRQQEERIQLED